MTLREVGRHQVMDEYAMRVHVGFLLIVRARVSPGVIDFLPRPPVAHRYPLLDDCRAQRR